MREDEQEEEEGRLRLRLLRALDGPPPNVVAKEEVEAELLVKLRSRSERDCGKLVVGLLLSSPIVATVAMEKGEEGE